MKALGVGVVPTDADTALRVAVAERRRGRTQLVTIDLHTRLAAPHHALTALPLARAAHRVLSLPFTDAPTLARVVPLELRGQLPTDPAGGRVGFEVIGRSRGASDVLALLVRQPDLDRIVTMATDAGVSLAGATLDVLALRWLLPAGFTGTVVLTDDASASVARWHDGAPRALRALTATDPAAVAAELAWSLPLLGADTGPLVVVGAAASALRDACARHDLTARPLSLDHLDLAIPSDAVLASPVACGLALGALDRSAVVPFAFAAADATMLTPRVRRLAVAAVLLATIDLGLARLDLARRDAHLTRALRDEAARALPGEPIVAPRAQIEAAAAAGRRTWTSYGTTVGRLREVSERIPEGLALDLTRLTLEGERLQLVGDAPTFETVDVLRRSLLASARLRDVATDEVRTTVDGKQVSFRLRARWVAPGEAPS
jgi:hypothetical protein